MEKDIERKERYEIVFLNGLDKLCSIQDTEAEIPTFYNDLGYINHIKPVCDLLNDKEETIRELKKENMEYYKLINCRKCKHHDYDWYDDGDEFEVCTKGNTERLLYHQFCEEYEKM